MENPTAGQRKMKLCMPCFLPLFLIEATLLIEAGCPGPPDQASTGSKRMLRSSQAERVIGALVEIRSMPVAP